MRRVYFLLGLFICLQGYGQGFDYVYSDDEYNFFIKTERSTGSIQEAWTKIETKERRVKNKQGKMVTIKPKIVAMEYWTCNCKERIYDVNQQIIYKSGEIVRRQHVEFEIRPIPDTVTEVFFNKICEEKEYAENTVPIGYEKYEEGYMNGYKDGYCYPETADCYNGDGSEVRINYPQDNSKNTYDNGYYEGYQFGKIIRGFVDSYKEWEKSQK